MSHVAIVARITVKEGKANEYLAAFAPPLEQAEKEPGTLCYAVHRSKDDPHVFWTTEVYADDDAFPSVRRPSIDDSAPGISIFPWRSTRPWWPRSSTLWCPMGSVTWWCGAAVADTTWRLWWRR